MTEPTRQDFVRLVRYRSDRVQEPTPVTHFVDPEARVSSTRLHAVCGRALVQDNLEEVPKADSGAVCDMCSSRSSGGETW